MDRLTLQFSAERSLNSVLIFWFGHTGPFSHVDFVLPDGRLLGARPDHPVCGRAGVQIRPPDYARFSRVLRVALPTGRAAAILDFARAQVGLPFDWTALLGFLLDRNWLRGNAWFCSELVAAALDAGGFWPHPWAFPCPVNKLDPDDLLLLLNPYLIPE